MQIDPMKESPRPTVEDYIKRTNLYEKSHPISFDLRGYAKYLEDHNISGKNIPSDVMAMFQRY